MRDKNYHAQTLAASRFVRHQPGLFAEAAQWVVSLRSKPSGARKSRDSNAYRTVEAVVLLYRSLLDSKSRVETQRDAYRTILTSWLLSADAHGTLVGAGSPYSAKDRPHCLRQLPVLSSHECMRISAKYALAADPRWRRLVRAAWEVVDDPGYLADDAPHGKQRQVAGETAGQANQAAAGTTAAESEEKRPLSEQALAMYQILCSLPETEGRTSKQLVKKLAVDFPGIDADRIRRLAQELKPYGIERHGSAGYFIPMSKRPKDTKSRPSDARSSSPTEGT